MVGREVRWMVDLDGGREEWRVVDGRTRGSMEGGLGYRTGEMDGGGW